MDSGVLKNSSRSVNKGRPSKRVHPRVLPPTGTTDAPIGAIKVADVPLNGTINVARARH